MPHASPLSWQDILSGLFHRYEEKIATHMNQVQERLGAELAQRTLDLCRLGRGRIHELGEDKANRWLGFVQGMLTASGVLSIEEERDYTRPLFHALKGESPSFDTRSPKL